MGKVASSAAMSLDGYVAKADNTIGDLFDWLQNGPVAVPTASPDITLHLTPRSAEYWSQWVNRVEGVIVEGTRRPQTASPPPIR